MNVRLFIYSSLLCANAAASMAGMAATLNIKNENEKPIDVIIPAEGNPLKENIHWLRATIDSGATVQININEKQMGEKRTFSVIGETNPLTPSGTCKSLSINKNYDIVFQNRVMGTDCVSTPVSNSGTGN